MHVVSLMGQILIGTTSWGDRSLIQSGRFYPEDATTSEARLRYFSSVFPITEIDTTYYGLPREEVTARWAEHTAEGFVFDVKAFRLFTQHRTPLRALPPDLRTELPPTDKENVYHDQVPAALRAEMWRRFRDGIEPLRRSGRLGVVLLQFAPWFIFRPESFEHIAACAAELEGYDVAVELRNKSWLNPRHRGQTLAFERMHQLVHVVTDEPQGFAASVPPLWIATVPELAVVRLHGRNRALWESKHVRTAAERFDYLYSTDELRKLATSVRELGARARRTHVLFNNCHNDYAQRNARTLTELLEAEAERRPEART